VKDFERLDLPEDDLARVWLAFSRLQRQADENGDVTMNGSL